MKETWWLTVSHAHLLCTKVAYKTCTYIRRLTRRAHIPYIRRLTRRTHIPYIRRLTRRTHIPYIRRLTRRTHIYEHRRLTRHKRSDYIHKQQFVYRFYLVCNRIWVDFERNHEYGCSVFLMLIPTFMHGYASLLVCMLVCAHVCLYMRMYARVFVYVCIHTKCSRIVPIHARNNMPQEYKQVHYISAYKHT
jgi:hypothetical protein